MARRRFSLLFILTVALVQRFDVGVCQSADTPTDQPPATDTPVAHVRTKLHTRITHRRAAAQPHDGENHVMSSDAWAHGHEVAMDEGYHDFSADCGAAMHVPKVALLFMSTGAMPMERVWAKWLQQAAGMLPIGKVGAWCTNPSVSWPESIAFETQDGQMNGAKIASMCAHSLRTGATALQRQALYSAYVHVSHGTGPLDSNSMFYKHVIPAQLDAQRFTHTMIEAERALLAAALQDPYNHRFALVSDSSVPLYDAVLVYEQFMSQSSYQDACDLDDEGWAKVDGYRYNDDLSIPGKMSYHNWRKSSQWFVLTRAHAEIVRDDALVDPVFKSQCWNNEESRERLCCSDEHYIPTLLNVLGEKDNTNCAWGSHFVNWCHSDPAPTIQSLSGRFVHAHELDAVLCHELSKDHHQTTDTHAHSYGAFVPLEPKCPVFFRKVDTHAAELAEAISFGVLGMSRR